MPEPKRKRKRKPASRKGGGQPGNKNALRHGFYAHLYTLKIGRELKDSCIEDELAIARYKARRLAELTPLKDKPTECDLAIFDRFNAMLITVNTLERTRLLARGHGGEIGQTILDALRELNPDEEL